MYNFNIFASLYFKNNIMKRIFLITMLSLGVFTATAQQVRFGVKGGVNISKFTSSNDFIKFNYRTAYHAGVLAEIALGNRFAIQPEVLYSTQGTKLDIDLKLFKSDATLKLDYVSVPVMMKLFVAQGLSLEVGPQISFNINSKASYKEVLKEKTMDVKKFVEPYSLSLCFGGGYEFGNFILSARYSLGLNKVTDESLKSEASGIVAEIIKLDDIKTGVIQVSVGYLF